MKRLLVFLLVLACLPGLYGCEEVEKAVPSPLSWADIDAIPVASADMTEEQLRQIVLDDSGNVLCSMTEPTTITDDREMFLGKVLELAEIGSLTDDDPLQLTVQVRVSTGQLLTAYTGTLVP